MHRRRGRPKKRPESIVADKGYDSDAFRKALWRRGIRPAIPFKRVRRPRPGPAPDLSGYKERWHVEAAFAFLGQFRRFVVRWEHDAQNYLAFIFFACSVITMRSILG